MEDQYLRRGLRLKSVSIAFQKLAEMSGNRRRKRELSRFTRTRTVSSGSELAVFDSNQAAHLNHASRIIN
ncbi:hypothetical protein DA077_03385 [Lactiplantibacillus paraplantarum]|uniref:Uncharacterized protein n=1 Tax=Lactiplantibacillus paraplantarum TaxID=60520 RepID=A0AAD0TMG7_9LACO|nr:hypothetical protein DA077_03385 [Lactiplantibacillus paraplantarum]AYJ37857.1 hypothetical protein LP667_02990 [Lactiplantibacillus paraplantarum]